MTSKQISKEQEYKDWRPIVRSDITYGLSHWLTILGFLVMNPVGFFITVILVISYSMWFWMILVAGLVLIVLGILFSWSGKFCNKCKITLFEHGKFCSQ